MPGGGLDMGGMETGKSRRETTPDNGAVSKAAIPGMSGMGMGKGGADEAYAPPGADQLAKVTRTVAVQLTDTLHIEPKQIMLSRGDVVKFVVKNEGKLQHDFMVDGVPEIDTGTMNGGETRLLVWRADKAGTFTTYCMVPGHREGGMVGRLTVK